MRVLFVNPPRYDGLPRARMRTEDMTTEEVDMARKKAYRSLYFNPRWILSQLGLKGEIKTNIGGGTVTDEWMSKMDSDAYRRDPVEAIHKFKILFKVIKAALELAKKARKG